MNKPKSLAQFGALLGDPVRSAILLHLSDGSSRPAGELAGLAGASPQAASAHLAQLLESGLLSAEQQGRHRFFRLASGEAAEIMEQLAGWIDEPRRQTRVAPSLRHARLCYDHLAGALGVRIFEHMSAAGLFMIGRDALELSTAGRSWCRDHGVSLHRPADSRRPMVRLCLDWTERRHHVGGHFGAAFTSWLAERRFIRQAAGSRAINLTREGEVFLQDAFASVLPLATSNAVCPTSRFPQEKGTDGERRGRDFPA